jgi:hypothetical protein
MSPALFFVKANVYGLNIIHEKYERLRWLRITRSCSSHLWIVRIKRLVRSPIRSGGCEIKACTLPCLTAVRELAGLFFPPVSNARLNDVVGQGTFGRGLLFFPARTEWHVRAGP